MTKPSSRRKKERAHVFHRLRGVFFECPAISSQELRVVNISETGIGIETTLMQKTPAVGDVLSGKLVVGYTTAMLQIKLAHFTPIIAGFEFVALPDVVRDAIRVYFEAELAGASLRLVNEVDHSWKYEDNKGNGLEISGTAKKEMKKFTISVLGNQVLWSQTEDLQLLQNESKVPVPDYLRKQLVNFIQSAHEVDRYFGKQIESILRFLPIDSA